MVHATTNFIAQKNLISLRDLESLILLKLNDSHLNADFSCRCHRFNVVVVDVDVDQLTLLTQSSAVLQTQGLNQPYFRRNVTTDLSHKIC
jgi:hypothetical protein